MKNIKTTKKRRPKPLLHVSIDRAKWDVWPNHKALFTENEILPTSGQLLRQRTGTMCCLGFVGETCGIPLARLQNQSSPGATSNCAGWPETLFKHDAAYNRMADSLIAEKLMTHNDNADVTAKKRETLIAKLGLAAGIRFTFRGRYLTKKDIKKG